MNSLLHPFQVPAVSKARVSRPTIVEGYQSICGWRSLDRNERAHLFGRPMK